MKILVWNCRGLGSSRAVRSLLDVQRQVRPDVFFLSETHLSKAKAEKVKRRVGFDHMLMKFMRVMVEVGVYCCSGIMM